VYSYVSTKENNTAAVMMNLPFSVIVLIPWYCDFEDSPMGSKPTTFEDWFWAPLITFGQVFVGVFIAIGMAFVAIFMMIVQFFVEIFMDILPILGHILWLIIRALLLVFMFIVFAFMLFFIFIAFIISMIFVPLIAHLINAEVSIELNKIILIMGEYKVVSEILITWEYKESVKMEVPAIIMRTSEGNKTYHQIKIASFSQSWASDIIELIAYLIKYELSKYAGELGLFGGLLLIFNTLALLGSYYAALALIMFFTIFFSAFVYALVVDGELITTHMVALLLGFIVSLIASLLTLGIVSFLKPDSVGTVRGLYICELVLVLLLFIPICIIWLLIGESDKN
jgi:hypothetical protein